MEISPLVTYSNVLPPPISFRGKMDDCAMAEDWLALESVIICLFLLGKLTTSRGGSPNDIRPFSTGAFVRKVMTPWLAHSNISPGVISYEYGWSVCRFNSSIKSVCPAPPPRTVVPLPSTTLNLVKRNPLLFRSISRYSWM